METRDFPEVARFVDRHRTGGLRPAADVARDVWGLLDDPPENGAVLDDSDLGP